MSTMAVEEYIAVNYEVNHIDLSINKFGELDTFFIGYNNSDVDHEINGRFINLYLETKMQLLVSSDVMKQSLKDRNVTPLKFVSEKRYMGQWGTRLYKNFEKIDNELLEISTTRNTEAQTLGFDLISAAQSKKGELETKELMVRANAVTIGLLEKERDLLKKKYKKANDLFKAQMDSIIEQLNARKGHPVAVLAPKRFIKLEEKQEVSHKPLHDYLKTNRKSVILLPKIPEQSSEDS